MKKFAEQYPGFDNAIQSSGITSDSIESIQHRILTCYDTLAVPLPDSAAWKRGKPAHARKAREEVGLFADMLGLSPLVEQYVAIACSAHDLGRMVQANKRAKTQPGAEFNFVFDDLQREIPYDNDDERHGYESNLLLRPILGNFAVTDAGRWLLDAVLHHSLKSNPTFEMCGGSEESLALCGIVRDIDKVLGFQDARSYTADPSRKAKERLQNWGKNVETDPEWGTELGCIDPAEFLLETPLEQPINRQQCRSYETYMLQYLKWIFGFARTEMQDVALYEGGPQIVAAYLLKQLEATPRQRVRLIKQLQDWRGGALLKPPVQVA